MSTSLQAIVFDFDGVLIDSEPLHLRAYQEVLAEEGVSLTEADYYERYLGFDDDNVFRAILGEDEPARLASLIFRKARRVERFLEKSVGLYAGAAELVRQCAAEVPLAIASGALRSEIERVLRRTGLEESFRVIVGAGETPRSKPAPDPYARAVALLEAGVGARIDAARSVAIEDSRWGIASARAAGLRCVAVTHTYPAEALAGADLVVEGLAALSLSRLRELVTRNGRIESG